jgi:two-component system, OmpR family, sensor kinase
MSLRSRLTLLYTSLVGGILLLFGVAVYVSVTFTVRNQLDDKLRQTALDVYPNINKDATGSLALINAAQLELPTDIYLQVHSLTEGLRYVISFASPNAYQYSGPLDPVSIKSQVPVLRDMMLGNVRLRMFTVPLVIGNRVEGVMQLGTSLDVVEAAQRTLLTVLLIGIPIAISISALAFWFSTRQALSSLENVTRVATQITRADDLSRRIPYNGPSNDEVGQLISAFNQTLGRLETLFNTQRRFLTDVGHELRTPLTVIKGNTSLMRRMACGDDESLSSIESEVDRLTRLVGDLLLLSQAESGKIPMVNQVVELDTLLLEVMGQMKVLARDRLQLSLGEIDQVLVCGDRDRLKQVLVNLIGNAINYTPPNGSVVVGLGKAQNQARLTVSDNGPGIPPEDLPNIFERFFRSEKSRTRTRDGKGFGLGLSIAYWIVRNHNGRIDVDSRLGVGTTFVVWLPLSTGDCQPATTLSGQA